ncbi:MAG: thiolase family protein [Lachnospiraceae bacterium]
MRNVVIAAACRTPIGTIGGQFKSLTALDLSIPVMQGLIQRSGIKGEMIDDVIWGCNYQRTYKENNLARVAAVKAGLPVTVPGITIHRNCTSSMSSIQLAYYQIKAEEAECIMAGGADSMSTAPHMVFHARFGQKYGNMELRDSMWDSLTNLGIGPAMGVTAENVAEKYHISRKQMDEFAYRSQIRAVDAMAHGRFLEEIIPVRLESKHGVCEMAEDEYPKKDITMEGLEKLRPAFIEQGKVTAGNSSGMNDASSGVLVIEESLAEKMNLPILARIISTATTGVDPQIMGIGPVSASRSALHKAGLTIEDIDLVEINEAFASQCLACQQELDIPDHKLNVNGGAISLGHPVGATGARIVTSLIYELRRSGKKYGLATLCAGGGMGTALILENRDHSVFMNPIF